MGTSLALAFFGTAISAGYYLHLKRIIMDDALTQSELVLHEVEAIRAYVKEVLRPKMYDLHNRDTFVIEAMSTTYISLNIMHRFSAQMPGFDYRRVSLNPHNPANRADLFEEEMFDWFEADAERRFWQGTVNRDDGTFLISMVPDYFEESCMRCHSDPQLAPTALIERYGPDGGFRFKAGDLGGLNSVSIPISKPLRQVRRCSVAIFLGAVTLTTLLLAVLNWLFGRLVLSRLATILETLGQTTDPHAEIDTPPIEGKTPKEGRPSDELDHLEDRFRHLRSYVVTARKGAGSEPNFIGPYVVTAPLAAGAMSWLYLGHHSGTKMPVTLKIPFAEILTNPLYGACLKTELRVLELTGPHPNLPAIEARIGDVLVIGSRFPPPLMDRLDRHGRANTALITEVTTQLCKLLGDLHAGGVAHHNICLAHLYMGPDNVLKLDDFGLASHRDLPDTIQESGVGPQGDRNWMAPEQLSGVRGDSRSDIYSVGVLLYRLLSGKLPTGMAGVDLNPGRLRADGIPGPWRQVITRALATEADRRYQWIEDLQRDIETRTNR
jgi:HAMP domain-containing protein